MKKVLFFFILTGLVIQLTRAQVNLFTQSFEGPVVANLVNIGDPTLTSGPSPCGKASYGDTSDFNSSMVNFFDGIENLTSFMAVNPQSPCGGYYDAVVYSDTFDLSGLDSAYFSCKYFKGNSLGWGPVACRVILTNGSASDTIESDFSAVNSWEIVSRKLSSGLIGPNVRFNIRLGGGDGVGMDDIMIEGYGASIIEDSPLAECKLYPNPAMEVVQIKLMNSTIKQIKLIDLAGKQVFDIRPFNSSSVNLPVRELNAGIYLVQVTDIKGNHFQQRLIVTGK